MISISDKFELEFSKLSQPELGTKSLERSPAVGDFYGTGIEIWAGFGPVRQLLRPVFSCFHGQNFFSKNIVDGENIFGIE
jgi:hypothetical protein